ncbi:hypothetical protein CYY_006523 [Polysphondylium violaceum]|uniref:PPM-type phosphatase domain-containing protein n=1 Tax=Polysphondylium violaceum TaxID=133409 RepID=A0A8J4V5W3_9MYCE|nr:hypothetical protein CYY_006523 [Polysphondylium violaceum]
MSNPDTNVPSIDEKDELIADCKIQNNETVDTTKVTEVDNNNSNSLESIKQTNENKQDKDTTENTSSSNNTSTEQQEQQQDSSDDDDEEDGKTDTATTGNKIDISDQPSTPLASHAQHNDITGDTPSPAKQSKIRSVKDIGVSFEKNPRYRRTMEDEHVIIDCFGGEPDQGYFAIYDGHGGRGAVEFTAKTLHNNLLEEINKDPSGDILEHFKSSYLLTDKQMERESIQFSGTTSITALIRNTNGQRTLYVANAGDARAVICHNKVAERLSYDHKGSDSDETKRIMDAGGFVVNNRVNGILAVTRSLGDHSMKEYVVGDPYKTSVKLDSNYTHLILACDGLWDVTTDQEAVDLILNETEAQQMSDKLLLHALKKGSTDNISIIVIIL